jgi:hypothetical protein
MLDLSDFGHEYPSGTRALDSVSLSIPRGMLLGPNDPYNFYLDRHSDDNVRAVQ